MLNQLRTWFKRQVQPQDQQDHFLRLLRILGEDETLRSQVLAIAQQSLDRRARTLDKVLDRMTEQNAPDEHIKLIGFLYRDDLCQALCQHFMKTSA